MGRTHSLIQRFIHFFDWRFWTAVTACGLVVLLIISMATADASRQRASRRITEITKERQALQGRVDALSEQQGRNTKAIEALSTQVAQMGGTPVVEPESSPRTTTTTTTPKNRPTQSPQSPANQSPGTTTPQQSPPPSTTPTTQPPKHLVGCVGSICL